MAPDREKWKLAIVLQDRNLSYVVRRHNFSHHIWSFIQINKRNLFLSSRVTTFWRQNFRVIWRISELVSLFCSCAYDLASAVSPKRNNERFRDSKGYQKPIVRLLLSSMLIINIIIWIWFQTLRRLSWIVKEPGLKSSSFFQKCNFPIIIFR